MALVNAQSEPAPLRGARLAAIFLGMSVATAVYFQIHLKFGASLLNVNLADPLAFIAFTILCWQIAYLRQLPQWRIPEFNYVILAFTGLMLLGFIIGWTKIGVTFWALYGRMLGWFIVLGYLSAGYLTVAYAGTRGMRLLCEALVTSAVAMVLWHAISRYLYQVGFDVGLDPPLNFEGFSGNRNAFVFQLLIAVALLLAYSPVYLRHGRVHQLGHRAHGLIQLPDISHGLSRVGLLLAGVLVGIVWTGSRAGMFVCAAMLLLAALIGLLELRTAIITLVCGGLLWIGFWLGEKILPSPVGNSTVSGWWTLPDYANLVACAALLLLLTWSRLLPPRKVFAFVLKVAKNTTIAIISSLKHALGKLNLKTVGSTFAVVCVMSGGFWLANSIQPVVNNSSPGSNSASPAPNHISPIAKSAPLPAKDAPPITARVPRTSVNLQSALSNDISNHERWETLKFGMELWRQAPILGAGLGVFYEKSPPRFGHSQVIHSTPLWVLAEFGLLGICVLGWAAFVLGRQALPALRGKGSRASAALLLVLLMFGLFSQAHEVFFQRTIWLVLGALLALPLQRSQSHD